MGLDGGILTGAGEGRESDGDGEVVEGELEYSILEICVDEDGESAEVVAGKL